MKVPRDLPLSGFWSCSFGYPTLRDQPRRVTGTRPTTTFDMRTFLVLGGAAAFFAFTGWPRGIRRWQTHTGDNIRADGISRNWTPIRMLPESGSIS